MFLDFQKKKDFLDEIKSLIKVFLRVSCDVQGCYDWLLPRHTTWNQPEEIYGNKFNKLLVLFFFLNK